jgi:hypothetical protein
MMHTQFPYDEFADSLVQVIKKNDQINKIMIDVFLEINVNHQDLVTKQEFYDALTRLIQHNDLSM